MWQKLYQNIRLTWRISGIVLQVIFRRPTDPHVAPYREDMRYATSSERRLIFWMLSSGGAIVGLLLYLSLTK